MWKNSSPLLGRKGWAHWESTDDILFIYFANLINHNMPISCHMTVLLISSSRDKQLQHYVLFSFFALYLPLFAYFLRNIATDKKKSLFVTTLKSRFTRLVTILRIYNLSFPIMSTVLTLAFQSPLAQCKHDFKICSF